MPKRKKLSDILFGCIHPTNMQNFIIFGGKTKELLPFILEKSRFLDTAF